MITTKGEGAILLTQYGQILVIHSSLMFVIIRSASYFDTLVRKHNNNQLLYSPFTQASQFFETADDSIIFFHLFLSYILLRLLRS